MNCQGCGRLLTDPESQERGYGPVCWVKHTGIKPLGRIRSIMFYRDGKGRRVFWLDGPALPLGPLLRQAGEDTDWDNQEIKTSIASVVARDFFPKRDALWLQELFVEEFLKNIPDHGFRIDANRINLWVKSQISQRKNRRTTNAKGSTHRGYPLFPEIG